MKTVQLEPICIGAVYRGTLRRPVLTGNQIIDGGILDWGLWMWRISY